MIFLGLGSNLGKREINIARAIQLLSRQPAIAIENVSSLYETEPWGLVEQPGFLNAVISVKTDLPPDSLLTCCLEVEKKLGRRRDIRWGPRIIDIDLLLYHHLQLCSAELTVPHPRLHERNFVLVPLNEIAGNEVVLFGCRPGELLRMTNDQSRVKPYGKVNWKGVSLVDETG
ncbi:7 8-dihydro-6-hydroxymethylpterin-pyrophosphokinase hppk [Lucifera butyrica]|uniref:2-amino-4-hydroxy-6-hydroxymethyldihydropteridine diphosphokinase n=1 Tax=Lucifera butyrica TaxID=1351585 RepID=A0A498RDB1_9FIRM|nr:2-amino-4-hydroxy-6-hydroxymethyldihydropteridine diphosphokinase [Lucifera butyrica]VBB08112.1 7 8-dihydro-6-hydroxymethylpterin-pyrophosphokinase hppk [Lucifera butyrica]